MKYIFIHGRAQQAKNPNDLKSIWVKALGAGAGAAGIPFDDRTVAGHTLFPYYGDTLISEMNRESLDGECTRGTDPNDVIRGPAAGGVSGFHDDDVRQFLGEVELEIVKKAPEVIASAPDAIKKAANASVTDAEAGQRGALNWPITLGLLGWLDSRAPDTSAAIVSRTLRDVGAYLEKASVRKAVDAIVKDDVQKSLSKGEPFTMVAHSLGSVVAYSVLHELGRSTGEKGIIKLITVGSPLAIKAVKKRLERLNLPLKAPALVRTWTNAADKHDVVALVPSIDDETFFTEHAMVVNNLEVHNETDNRHGISGYLNKGEVAKATLTSR